MSFVTKEVSEKLVLAFKALPNVKKVWVTEDGEYHIHPVGNSEEVGRPAEDDLNTAAQMIEPTGEDDIKVDEPLKDSDIEAISKSETAKVSEKKKYSGKQSEK